MNVDHLTAAIVQLINNVALEGAPVIHVDGLRLAWVELDGNVILSVEMDQIQAWHHVAEVTTPIVRLEEDRNDLVDNLRSMAEWIQVCASA